MKYSLVRRILIIAFSILLMASIVACESKGREPATEITALLSSVTANDASSKLNIEQVESTPESTDSNKKAITSIKIAVEDKIFTATLAENEAVNGLVELMKNAPVVIQMSDYLGFEKVGSLGKSLPESNLSITTKAGDIVLYNGNQIVVFYGSNSWSYTKLGEIDDLIGLEEALGSGNVTLTFFIE